MPKSFLKWIFKRYKMQFYDMAVADFFGDIPENLRQPSLEFLANGRNTLERFFSVQAYLLTKKAVNDGKNTDFYSGALMISKALLHAIRSEPMEKDKTGSVVAVQQEDETLKNISEFEKQAKEKNKPK